jgi:hypothetical protein
MITQSPLMSSNLRSTVSKVIPFAPCSLIWRDCKLHIQAERQEESMVLDVLKDTDRVVECLRRSPVKSVELDSDLSPEMMLWWAEACNKAKKTCYITLPSPARILSQPKPLTWLFYKSIHRMTAIILAIVMLPFLLLVLTPLGTSVLEMHQQWAVGERGQLLQMWVWQEPLDSSRWIQSVRSFLLKIINVIQGELLLNAPMPNALEKAIVS